LILTLSFPEAPHFSLAKSVYLFFLDDFQVCFLVVDRRDFFLELGVPTTHP